MQNSNANFNFEQQMKDNDIFNFLRGFAAPPKSCDFCTNPSYRPLVKLWGKCPKCGAIDNERKTEK